jgi:RHS repeat-associated protein
VGLVNDSATKVNSYSYDPYGVQLSASQQIANPWRYASGHLDGGTGLTKFGARYYDPALGRFTQRDPSGKDLPYAYANCDPANRTDPTGHSWRCKKAEWGARALGVAVGGALGFGVGTLAGGPAGAAIGAGIGGTVVGAVAGGFVDTACSAQEDNKPFSWSDASANIFFGIVG